MNRETSNTPFLTFCIPTYNRVERVRSLVTNILSLPDDDIEIVVLDNGSDDGTFEELSKIRDSRFHVLTNGENRGALYNMLNVFKCATRVADLLYITHRIYDFSVFIYYTNNPAVEAFGYTTPC